MKTFTDIRKLKEDGGGAAVGGPTVTTGSGAVAGMGQPPGSKSGEPGVNMKKKKLRSESPILQPIATRKPPQT